LTLPPAMPMSSRCVPSLATLDMGSLLHFSHYNKCIGISSVALFYIYLMINDAEHLCFHISCWPSVCLLWKNVYSDLLTVLNQLFGFFATELNQFFIYFGY